MADPSQSDQSVEETGVAERGSAPGMPLWVKVFGVIVILLVVLLVFLHLTGNSLGGVMPQGH
jgi:hypothetical protein